MKKGMILFERLPVARIGVENVTENIVITSDYSCLGYMLEEYISYGVVKIVMPKSSVEVNFLDQIPPLLQKRITVIDDQNEIESVDRVLYNLRQDFGVIFDSQNIKLKYLESTPTTLRDTINYVHEEFKKLALGFNHGIQIDINISNFKKALQTLKRITKNGNTRVTLSEIEGLLNQYTELHIVGIKAPKQDTPQQIVTLFDNLLNDEKYLEYSSQMNSLSLPNNRQGALLKLREIEHFIKDNTFISAGWDYVTKILKVFKILELPESKVIASFFNDRNLPIIHDMTKAKQSAIDNWKANANTNIPLSVDGSQIGNNVTWLPPLSSIKVQSYYNHLSLGTLGELKDALRVFSGDQGL